MIRLSVQQDITTKYLDFLYKLPETKQQHFLSRLYKITGEKSYLTGIQEDAYTLFSQKLASFSESGTLDIDMNHRFNIKAKIPRQRVRNEYIHNHKEVFGPIFVYLDVLMAFNVIHRYHMEDSLDPSLYSHIQTFLDEGFSKHFELFLSSPEYVLNTPVQVINILYWYYHLPSNKLKGDEEERLEKYIINSYQSSNLNQEILFLNYLYTLTHVIIGKSWFYEYKVDLSESNWIYSFFTKNKDTIFQTKEPDIIAEIGVCYCLQKTQSVKIIESYQSEIIQYFNENQLYIPTGSFDIGSDEDLILGEHRNILAIMLLSGMKNLYPFPTKD